jgi:hypothetical protein
MIRRYWLLTATAALSLTRVVAAEEPVLLNADQISFQLSRTKSLLKHVTIDLPAVTFIGATDNLTVVAKRQLDELAGALGGSDEQARTFAIVAGPAPSGPDGIAKRRADAVRDYLVRHRGVSAARFTSAEPTERAPVVGVALVLGP